MTIVRLTAFIGLAGVAAALRAGADEVNAAPGRVHRGDPAGDTRSWSVGPFLFSKPAAAPDPGRASGLRPLYVDFSDRESEKTDILYPLFFYRKYPEAYKWSVFQLINGEGDSLGYGGGGPTDRHFDVWPFYFSHETGDPADTYHALFPVFGTMKYRLGYNGLTWAPFPLYVQTDRRNTRVTYVPWPFIRFTSGDASGFGVWPIFGATHGPGPARNSFFLWPLGWDNTVLPGPQAPDGAAPSKQFGFLPFYTRDQGPGTISENYLWPFFGYTERTSPDRYSERRYFWPFLVQGKGDDRLLDRWGPLYTHSIAKGSDSTWVMWPLWHRTTWADSDIEQSRTQFFYFVYWSLDERSVSRPAAARATKRHIWPLLSIWDNGAGSRQVAFPSPLEVFFPDNPDMREVWTPLFTVYRYDRRPSGESRSSLLWDTVTWTHDGAGNLAKFRLGPLLAMNRGPGGPGWRILGFDLGPKPGKVVLASR